MEPEVMNFNQNDSRNHRWGVILAGGDGKRLLPLTRKIAGDDRPKQFCSVMGKETLLQQTQRRISGLLPRLRTLLVLTGTQEAFYADQLDGIPSSEVLIQPSNRGTAPAIVYSLLRHMEAAYAAAASRPERVILLGIPPDSPEVEYGWIEPGVSMDAVAPSPVSPVSRFWEKPHKKLATALMARGCLWNSFVMVGRVNTFLKSIRASLSTASGGAALRRLYSGIPSTSFSTEVLSMRPNDLAVLCATGLGWSDLGEPGRVLSVLERRGVETEWGFKPACPLGRTGARMGGAG